jgi:hypothetical protein
VRKREAIADTGASRFVAAGVTVVAMLAGVAGFLTWEHAEAHASPAARGDQEARQRRDSAGHRAQLQCQPQHDFAIDPEGGIATMEPRLDAYLAPIGKLTIAAALLEEVVIRWGALLFEPDHSETHAKTFAARAREESRFPHKAR